MNKKKIVADKSNQMLLIVALFFTFTVCVYAPLEMYVGNIAEFWFTIQDILWLVICINIIAFLLLGIVGVFLPLKIKKIYIALIFGLALCIYIQGNFLNQNFGVLNGANKDLSTYNFKFILDFIIWAIIFTAIAWLVKKSKGGVLIKYIAAFLTLTQLISLVILCMMTDLSKNNAYLSSKNQFSISKNENIIVFVLDMFDDSYFPQILEKNSSLSKELNGFTYFDNSVGGYPSTNHSISLILTGKYHKNETSFPEYIKTSYEENYLYKYLLDNNYDLDIYTSEEYAVSPGFRVNVANNCNERFVISNHMAMTRLLYNFVSLKYMPNICKKYLSFSDEEFNELKTEKIGAELRYDFDNVTFYNKLLAEGIKAENDKNAFKFYHVKGAHFPYTNDENCSQVKAGGATHLQAAEGAFKIVEEYINELKELNKYDDSTIVVVADHGWYDAGVLTNPLMLVKPKYAGDGQLKVSHAPVSQGDIHPTILKSISAPEISGKSMFEIEVNESRKRCYYSYDINFHHPSGNMVLTEFSVPDTSNNTDDFIATGFKYLEGGEYVDASQYASYKLGTTMHFNENYDGSRWFDYGLGMKSTPVQKHAQMSLTLEGTNTNEKIFAAFFVDEVYGERQHIIVRSGDQILYNDFIFPGDKGFEFEIPKALVENSKIKFEFEFPDAFAERDINKNSHDAKKLSVLFSGFSIDNKAIGLNKRLYQEYDLGEEILFNEVMDGTIYFKYGIGVNEPQFGVAWSSGKEAEFSVHFSEAILDNLNVYIDLGLIYKDSQHIVIKGGGGNIYYDNIVNSANSLINFSVPKEDVKNGVLQLVFEYPNAEKSELDDRCLSIAFRKIIIR